MADTERPVEADRPAALSPAAEEPSAEPAAEAVAAAVEPPAADAAGDLEEEYLPPTSAPEEPLDSVQWDELTLTVEATLPGPWHLARKADGECVLLRLGDAPAWNGPMHRLMPQPLLVRPEGYLLPWQEGTPLLSVRSLAELLPHFQALAQLVRFFQAQGQSVVDLDPDHLVVANGALKLRVPPRLVPVGAPLPTMYREGRTAPEMMQGSTATGKEGVYLLGALLYHCVTGSPLAEGGFSRLLLSGIKEAGLPQVLARALAPAAERATPQAFLESLRGLAVTAPPVLRVGAATSVGLNPDRPMNEDSFAYSTRVVEAYGGRVRLLRACVADGMGGMEAGEVASRAAAEEFVAGEPPHPVDAPEAQADWTNQLGWWANEAVVTALGGGDGGCTFTGAVFVGARFTIAHVGDTRAYLVGPGYMKPLTRDHSLVAAMVANGMMSAEEAATSPDRNKVLRSMGGLRAPQPGYIDDLAPATGARFMELGRSEAVMFMSDGVWGEVGAAAMDEIVQRHLDDPQQAAEALVQAALDAGAPDNATVVVVYRER